jgi:hypothetical protein
MYGILQRGHILDVDNDDGIYRVVLRVKSGEKHKNPLLIFRRFSVFFLAIIPTYKNLLEWSVRPPLRMTFFIPSVYSRRSARGERGKVTSDHAQHDNVKPFHTQRYLI